MNRGIVVLLSISVAAAAAEANTFRVDTVKSGGARSLRWAINRANAHTGPDRIIFNSSLIGGVIKPTTELPPLTDAGTTINGDINRDGLPDVTLNGSRVGPVYGLRVLGNDCLIQGLSIVRFQNSGLVLDGVTGCRVWGCHLGVNRRGDTSQTNAGTQLAVQNATGNTIGKAGLPNIISAGTAGPTGLGGLRLMNAQNNVIEHNYLGLRRAGNTSLGDGSVGVALSAGSGTATGNVIRSNRFGGLTYGVILWDADRNRVRGNWFGLGTDGRTALPIISDGILVEQGSSGNVIGGPTTAARNVFVGGRYGQGIEFSGAGNNSNRIQGNYFGTTADGTQRRTLARGIVVHAGSNAQLIGGTAAAGNYFVPRSGVTPTLGVDLDEGGSGTTIQHNTFGVLPAGGDAPTDGTHVDVWAVSDVQVLDNLIAGATYGVFTYDPHAGSLAARFFRNTIRDCTYGVYLAGDVSALLGNLGNASTADDGGNRFGRSNQWHIWNGTANRVRAEGNSFGTTVRAQIDAHIRDKLDDAAAGRVDFDPLQGGVHPSGSSEVVLALTGTAAVATAGGAEIVYTLSVPAQVTVEVVNIAGRPIADIVHDQASGAGLQRTLWNGRSNTGTAAPAGPYLVRITARSAAGGQASALAPLRLTAGRR